MQDFLKRVDQEVTTGMVAGSDMKRINEQVLGLANVAEHVFAENGCIYYRQGAVVDKMSITTYLGEEKINEFMSFILQYISQAPIPVKRGSFVEFRNNMINISPCGRAVSDEERDRFAAYDKQHKVRKNMVKELNKKFKSFNLMYSIAGQISFDVYPKGWDKTYCLKHLEKEKFDTIHFFGDRTESGGNDHELFKDKRVIGHKVTGPDDTKKQVTELLQLS